MDKMWFEIERVSNGFILTIVEGGGDDKERYAITQEGGLGVAQVNAIIEDYTCKMAE